MKRNRRSRPPVQAPSAFAGFRFPPDAILLAVRCDLRHALSYRDLDEVALREGLLTVTVGKAVPQVPADPWTIR